MRTIKSYWPIIIVLLVYVILLGLYFSHFNFGWSKKNEEWGTFGDFFGGSLSPLIGVLSVVLTYKIINNQNRENQQSEFKYIFEILFNSIDQKRESIERKSRPNLEGRKAINRINKDIQSVYTFNKRNNPNEDGLTNFRKAFWAVHEEIHASSSPYMKILHNSLKAIDNHCIENRREEYASMLRAQLHKEELVFIFYNGIAEDKFSDFKNRIEKYSLLKEIWNYALEPELKDLYDPKAFEENERKSKKFYHYNRTFSYELKFTFNRN